MEGEEVKIIYVLIIAGLMYQLGLQTSGFWLFFFGALVGYFWALIVENPA